MFHSKQDVDRHVDEVFKNIKSEYQRNLKCYQIAKLYYKFKDYKSAIKYINRYIFIISNSAAAHRLLGECYLGINLKAKALNSFKTSLELNGSQHELVLKVCSLLMDPEVAAVSPRATYWLERAESLFPTNPIVFQLKEHLLKSNADGKQENGQLEKLILSEIAARPTDVTVRIRLLNFFMDTKRYKLAYQHALEIEDRNTFSNDLRWYDCLCNVVQAYEKANSDLGFSFFIKKIIFLEKRADLFMQEFQDEVKLLPECSSALFAFDQNLHLVSKNVVSQDENYFFPEFLKHMRCQLSFHLATLVLKRAKKEYGMWQKAFRSASAFLLQATQTTMNLDGAWYNMWNGKNKMEREVKQLNKSAALRISQAGHILLAWSQSNGPKFLERVSQFSGGKWQNNVYSYIFYNKEHQQATATSHFINDPFFSYVPMQLLSETELAQFDEVSQSAFPDSLHHIVWLGLAYCNANGQLSPDFRCVTVPELQFTVENLSQFGPETLNQLDVDAFLYSSVLCAKSAVPSIVSSDRPNRLPISISEELCSPAQAEWWNAVYKTYSNQATGNISEMRLKLRKGIETIRVFGQHGMHVKVIVMLAKIFQERAAKNKNPNELNGLEERAYLYWTAAIPLLEKLAKNQQLREVSNRLFDYRGKNLTSNEIKGHLEDGRLFLACRLMKQGRHEQAIEAFQSLKSPYATFYQGLIYEKLASEEMNHRPEAITSENRSQHIVLLTRARDAFYLTLDRLRCPSVDSNHPLNAQLQDHLEQIEKRLAMIDPDSTLNRNGDSESNDTNTSPGPLSPDVDENLDASFNVYNTSNFLGIKNNSASRTPRHNFSDKHHTPRFEARPSPERLDAQLRHLVQANSNGLQAIIEQLKEIKSLMQIELKDLGCVTRDLLAEMKRWNDKLESTSKKEIMKPEDLFELREEDYEDFSQLSQQYNPYPNYGMNRPMTGTQGTSTVTYGTPVPSPVPAVPPVLPTPETPLLPQAFYPGAHSVSSIDPSILLYQTLGYYAQGMPGYGDNQNVPDFRGAGIQKGAPFVKNAFRAPDPVATTTITTKAQPPNVVITSSDTLPAFTNSGTPTMSVTIPPQHIRGATPTTAVQKPFPGQVHPFQIPMPPQAQMVKESPTEKLNSILPTTSLPTTPVQTVSTSVQPSPVQQTSQPKEMTPTKSTPQTNIVQEENKPQFEIKTNNETKLFESRGKFSVFRGKEWEDWGTVLIKILHDEKVKKARIIVFQEQLFKVFADHYITSDMAPESLNSNGWVWSASNLHGSDLEPHEITAMNPIWRRYRVQFNTLDEAKDFGYAFNEGRKFMKETSKTTPLKANITKGQTEVKKECKSCKGPVGGNAEKCSACETKEKSTDKINLGGFTFMSSPIIKPQTLKLNDQKEKPKDAPKPSPFSQFSFSTSAPIATSETKTAFATSKEPFSSVSVDSKSENLFAAVKPGPNSFVKDANFKFEGTNAPVFGYLNKTPPGKTEKQSGDKTKSKEDDEKGAEEFVPTAEFAPVVDLPDLVDVKTGEENDKALFDEKAKLLRFDTNLKEWKERGVGNMKVLLNEESGKVRLIMRRDLVLKVCCNHYLDEQIDFKRMMKSDKALTWYAQDYSEGELKAELFALRFRNPEAMVRFETVIKNTQSKMKDGRMEGTNVKESEKKTETLKPLSELFKPKAGSWECETCLIRNDEKAVKCVSCETPKPGTEAASTQGKSPSQPTSLGTGIKFEPSATKYTFGIPQSTTSTTSTSFSTPISKPIFGVPQTTTVSTGFTFGIPPASSTVAITTTTTSSPATTFTFGTPLLNIPATSVTSTTNKFSFGTNVTSTTTAVSSPSFSFRMPMLSSTTAATVITSSSTPSFSLGTGQTTTTTTTTPTSKLPFSMPSSNVPTTKTEKPFSFNIPQKEEEKPKMGKETSSSISFATVLKPEGKEKFEFDINKIKPAVKPPSSKTSPSGKDVEASGDGGASEDSDGAAEEESGDHIVVKPIVPLPKKIDIYTGEEDEDLMYEKRAKLFRFSNKEWKERGIGNVKILRHKTTRKIRLLMRRETVLKVCLNHYVTPDLEFMPKDEKTWHWTAADFSEEKVSYDMFAIRFKNPEIAQEFKKTIDEVISNPDATPIKAEVKDKTNDPSAPIKNFTFPVEDFPGTEPPKSSTEDDIVVVYENKVTPEQREKAMSLHLPPNFYAYLEAPGCPGCAGCEKDDPPAQSQETVPNPSVTTPASKPVFGSTSDSKPVFGSTPDSKPLFGSTPDSKPVFETTPASKPVFGSTPDNKPVFGTTTASKPVFGTTPDSKPVFGTTPDNKPVFGTTTASKPIFGTTSDSKPVFGTTTASKPIFGTTSDSKPVFGSTPDSKPVFGSTSDSKPVFGSTSDSKPVFGSTPDSKPVFGSISASKPIFGSTPASKPVFGSTPSWGTLNLGQGDDFKNKFFFGSQTSGKPNLFGQKVTEVKEYEEGEVEDEGENEEENEEDEYEEEIEEEEEDDDDDDDDDDDNDDKEEEEENEDVDEEDYEYGERGEEEQEEDYGKEEEEQNENEGEVIPKEEDESEVALNKNFLNNEK